MRLSYFTAILLFLLFTGCDNKPISVQLAEVDSLVVAELNDSAYQLVKSLDEKTITNPEDRAHYNLLMTQTSILAGSPLPSDSLLDVAIGYYQQTDNKEKLADAYYYKGINAYNAKDDLLSMTYFKKAEEMAEKGGTLRQRYKIAECISFVNNINGKYDLALNYAKQALLFAKRINNKRWLADAYYRLGDSFSHIGMQDSAVYYFSEMEPYIKEVPESYRPHMLTNLALAYMERDQKKAKILIQEVLHPVRLLYSRTTRLHYDNRPRRKNDEEL